MRDTYSRPCDHRNRQPNYNCSDCEYCHVHQTEVRFRNIRSLRYHLYTGKRLRSPQDEHKHESRKDQDMTGH